MVGGPDGSPDVGGLTDDKLWSSRLGVGGGLPTLRRKNVTQHVTKLHTGPHEWGMNEIWFFQCKSLYKSSSLKTLAKYFVKYKLDLVWAQQTGGGKMALNLQAIVKFKQHIRSTFSSAASTSSFSQQQLSNTEPQRLSHSLTCPAYITSTRTAQKTPSLCCCLLVAA
jgi:hypothetical protein